MTIKITGRASLIIGRARRAKQLIAMDSAFESLAASVVRPAMSDQFTITIKVDGGHFAAKVRAAIPAAHSSPSIMFEVGLDSPEDRLMVKSMCQGGAIGGDIALARSISGRMYVDARVPTSDPDRVRYVLAVDRPR